MTFMLLAVGVACAGILAVVVFLVASDEADFGLVKFIALVGGCAAAQLFVIPFFHVQIPGSLLNGLVVGMIVMCFLLAAGLHWLLYVSPPKALFCAFITVILWSGMFLGGRMAFGLGMPKSVHVLTGGSLDDDDYISLIFSPSLWDELDLDPVQRVILADWNQRIGIEMNQLAIKSSAGLLTRVQALIDDRGVRVKTLLGEEELNAFHQIFIRHGSPYVRPSMLGGTFMVRYPHFGEEGYRDEYQEWLDFEEQAPIYDKRFVLNQLKSRDHALEALKHQERGAYLTALEWFTSNSSQSPNKGDSEVTVVIRDKILASPEDFVFQRPAVQVLRNWGDASATPLFDYSLALGYASGSFAALSERNAEHAAWLLLMYARDEDVRKMAFNGIKEMNPDEAKPVLELVRHYHPDLAEELHDPLRRIVRELKLDIPIAESVEPMQSLDLETDPEALEKLAMSSDTSSWAPAMSRLMQLDPVLARQLFEERADSAKQFRISAMSVWADRFKYSEDHVLPLLLSSQYPVVEDALYLLFELAGEKTPDQLNLLQARQETQFTSEEIDRLNDLRESVLLRIPALEIKDRKREAAIAEKANQARVSHQMASVKAETLINELKRARKTSDVLSISRSLVSLDKEDTNHVPDVLPLLLAKKDVVMSPRYEGKYSYTSYYDAIHHFGGDTEFLLQYALGKGNWPHPLVDLMVRDPGRVTHELLSRSDDHSLWKNSLEAMEEREVLNEAIVLELMEVESVESMILLCKMLRSLSGQRTIVTLGEWLEIPPSRFGAADWKEIEPYAVAAVEAAKSRIRQSNSNTDKQILRASTDKYPSRSPSALVATAIHELKKFPITESESLRWLKVIAANAEKADKAIPMRPYAVEAVQSELLERQILGAKILYYHGGTEHLDYFKRLAREPAGRAQSFDAWSVGVAGMFRYDPAGARDIIREMASTRQYHVGVGMALRSFEFTPEEKEIIPLLKEPNFHVLHCAIEICEVAGGSDILRILPKLIAYHQSALTIDERERLSRKIEFVIREVQNRIRKEGNDGVSNSSSG